MRSLPITGQDLTLVDLVAVARDLQSVHLTEQSCAQVSASEALIGEVVDRGAAVYGVTTGFGKFASVSIPIEKVSELQTNLLRSHAAGVGNTAGQDITRAMLLLRINALANGVSGIRLATLQVLVDMLNRNVLPVVPEKGSVGASGDLAPLAHLALPLIGEGEAIYNGQRLSGADAMRAAGLEPVSLAPKEGLALINGTQLMTSVGGLVLWDALRLARTADIAGCLSLDAVRGTDRAFDARIHAKRPHRGQVTVAGNLRRLMAGSAILSSHRHDSHRVQDPYSLRCMPQVHGAARDVLEYAHTTVCVEMNSATDNPLVFADTGDVISGGNFHGEPIAIAMDSAVIGIAELANISERRVALMMDSSLSELPPFLAVNGGLDSGYMVAQYTAAALVSENKVLAHPASVDSIPTSANQEDHVSMGVTSALKARQVVQNAETVIAIELLSACEGLEHRSGLKSSEPLEAVRSLIRQRVPPLQADRPLYPAIEAAVDLVREGQILCAVQEVVGLLD